MARYRVEILKMTQTRKIYKDSILTEYMGTERQRKMIVDKIRATFAKADAEGRELNEEGLRYVIMVDHGVTAKKAQEYINLARVTRGKDTQESW